MRAEIELSENSLLRMEYPKTYKGGAAYLDIRVWWKNNADDEQEVWKPSKKGVTVPMEHIETFIEDLLAITKPDA